MSENKDEIYIQTKAKNGLKVRIPLSKMEDFKKSQENPNKEKIAEAKEKSLELFKQKREKLEKSKSNK